jgi:hypothetical protein
LTCSPQAGYIKTWRIEYGAGFVNFID